ncbi:ImuA family protein [Propylenella binzhouense]|uniref:ImuA family protein n=1 Tax=Propylenella binzhouense TaxID=2555902 RepID=UPI00136AD451|nr:hypothetical protein [Propylenella binzhouense]
MATPAEARAELCRLRREIARIEGRPAEDDRMAVDGDTPGGGIARLAFGIPPLDAALGGGLACAALHEIRTAETREGAAGAGFAAACLIRLTAQAGRRPILWIGTEESCREAGRLHAPGLLALGLDPALIVSVVTERPADALWAFEAGLACRGLAAAVCELRRGADIDLTETRRCALRAHEAGVTGFLLRFGAAPEPTAAETRWRLGFAPAGPVGLYAAGVGRPAWRVEIEKNRAGRTGAHILEWNAHERRFETPAGHAADAHPVALAAPPFDRSDRPAGEGFRRAS